MKKKKIFAVIFSVVFTVALLGGLSMTTYAANDRIVDGIQYELVGRGAEQEYRVKMGWVDSGDGIIYVSGDIVIPDEIDGIPVTEISDSAFSKNYRIKSVTIGANVIRIQNDAFRDCKELASVVFGANVEVIGQRAFESCNWLRSVTLGDKITNVQTQAFGHCIGLESITMGMGLETIGENAFEGCHSLKAVTLPDSVSLEGTGIGEEARVSLNETLEAEFPKMVAQRDKMQAELDAFSNRVETVREFLRTGKYNTASSFGSGKCTIIIVCTVIVTAVIIGGIVVIRKKSTKKKKEEAQQG